jgi:ubiquinone/menaquinone biosynthesis C-methylase UbiE
MRDPEDIKRQEKEIYNSIAPKYDACLVRYNARFASDMIDLLYPQQGDAALDVAGGSGAAGLKLAERIGPGGSVVISDLSSEMLRLAQTKATERKLDNIQTAVMDAEKLLFPDDSFDIVTCSFGVMSFTDVPRALSEIHRVLKPCGRIGFSVWSLPERLPFYAEPTTAFLRHAAPVPVRAILRLPLVKAHLLRKLLMSGNPLGFSPTRFSKSGSLEKHLLRAGFESVRRLWFAHALEFPSFDSYWDMMMDGNPGATVARKLPESTLAAIREELRGRLVSPRTGGVRLFNEAAIILAAKPSRNA